MTARAKLYMREVPGARGHVMVGISTGHLCRLERAEHAAFARMIRPGSLATYSARRSRWKRLRAAVLTARASWERLWRIA